MYTYLTRHGLPALNGWMCRYLVSPLCTDHSESSVRLLTPSTRKVPAWVPSSGGLCQPHQYQSRPQFDISNLRLPTTASRLPAIHHFIEPRFWRRQTPLDKWVISVIIFRKGAAYHALIIARDPDVRRRRFETHRFSTTFYATKNCQDSHRPSAITALSKLHLEAQVPSGR